MGKIPRMNAVCRLWCVGGVSAWIAMGRLCSVLTRGFLPRPGLAHFLLIFNADLLTRWCILQLVFPSDKLYRH